MLCRGRIAMRGGTRSMKRQLNSHEHALRNQAAVADCTRPEVTPIYHVTAVQNREAILRDGLMAKAGSWQNVVWKRRVFFTTTRISAYEITNSFMHERREEYLFVLVDPAKMRGKLRPDRDYDRGVWTSTDVPPEAIIGVEEVDESFFE